MMNLHTALACLAYDVTQYESAWRASVASRAGTPERDEADSLMYEANQGRDDLIEAIAEDVGGVAAARAIEAALIMAAARTTGHRPAEHINQRSRGDVRSFISEHVAES